MSFYFSPENIASYLNCIYICGYVQIFVYTYIYVNLSWYNGKPFYSDSAELEYSPLILIIKILLHDINYDGKK